MWISEATKLAVTSHAAVKLTVYSATGSRLGSGHGTISLWLDRGLYRVHLERCGIVRELLVDHDQETTLHDPGPPLHTPVPLANAVTSHDYYSEPARRLSVSDTYRPLGHGPHSARLFIFIRRMERNVGPPHLPSEPITIHDLAGRKLAMLGPETTQSDDETGYVAFSVRVAAGTYRLRAAHSRRQLAITIPENRAAHVFIADSGAVRLDDLRVALVDLDRPFNPESDVAFAMESLLAALKSPALAFPPDARLLLPDAVEQDLCFGIASAHQLWRCEDKSAFDQIMQWLMSYAQLPDVAILAQLRQTPSLTTQARYEAPPLMRASLVMAVTRPEFELSAITPDSVFARAAGAGLHDSIWCTWGTGAWDEQWIEPTVESLHGRGLTTTAIARMVGLPPRTAERALNESDKKLPLVNGTPTRVEDMRIPGYALGEILGQGLQGTVFRATRLADGQAVALKIMPLVGGKDQRERIEHDLDRLRGLRHPGLLVCSHWATLPNDAGMWFDMELCHGSVFDLLSISDTPLPFERTCQVVLEALDTVAYLHGEGLVHGNIKPSNVLVRTTGSVAIADYGLTLGLLHAGQFIATGRRVGRARFMPHEALVNFERAAPTWDVWSMAATLYFLLTLDLPRDEYADQSDLEVVLENSAIPIAERWTGVPAELARCLDRALSDDVRVRPMDAAQLRKNIVRALGLYSSQPTSHAPSGDIPVPPTGNTERPKDETEAFSVPSLADLSSSGLLPVRRPEPSQKRSEEGSHRHPEAREARLTRIRKATMVETWQTERQEDSAVGLTDRDHAIAHLRVLTGRTPNQVHVFESSGTSIGRVGGDCDFLVGDGRMSRRHARIERSVTGWRLQDLVSRNGGFVDGHGFGAGDRMPLVDGAVIRLGDSLMVFRTSAPTSDGRADSPVFPGISPVVVTLRRRIDALAQGSRHVLILGEAGTGKERVAKAIGDARASHPFVTLNSAELSRDLARSELFGHVRGAFTDANANKLDLLVDMAGDGVLFLDDVGELSLDVQAELLRFLQDGSYRPLGSTELRHSSARVVAATHVDLDQAVQNNKFRRDLLARLRTSNVPLELPPLRERREDILGWTQLFLRQGNYDAGLSPWTVDALECLLLYPWNENLRGLDRVIVEAAAQSSAFPFGIEHLPAEIRAHRETLRAHSNPSSPR